MHLGLHMGLSRRGGAASFSPASLFPGAGAWYDPSDLTTLFQNSNGTGAVSADGDRVGYIADKSGNGNHAIQAAAGSRATYRTSGGLHWLEFDGVDDGLANAPFTAGALAQPHEMVFGFRPLTLPANNHVIGGAILALQADGNFYMFSGGGGPAKTLTNATDYVANARFNVASSRLRVNGGSYSTGNPSTDTMQGIGLAQGSGGGANVNMRLYGYIGLGRAMTAGEIANAETYMAVKSGVTLP